MTTKRLGLSALVVTGLAGCADLPEVTEGICGNGVIETGEDCEASTLDADGNVTELCGAADGDNACFFAWSDAVACPPGYGAGADGRCRQATGRFEPGGTLRLVVDDLEIGDVDGDLFDDVITASGTSVQVSFGSTQADLASSVVTQVSTSGSGLEVGDVDGDGFDDLFIATAPGIQTFLGADDRALDPFSYPQVAFEPSSNFVLGFPVDLVAGSPEQEVLTIWEDQIGFPFVVGGPPSLITLPSPNPDASRLVGPAIARTGENRAIPGDVDASVEVALAYAGSDTVHVYRATSAPVTMTNPGTALSLGAGINDVVRGGSALLFGYWNGDGCRDLLVNTGVANSKLVLFRGELVGADCTGNLLAVGEMMDLTDNQLRVLAVNDFDGDGISDFVTSRGVYRVTGTSAPWTMTPVSTVTEPYLDALIVDLNGDGKLDAAAFHESLPDVDVLINASIPNNPVFNRFVIPTADAVLRLASGDFDGDLTDDVAIVETDGGSELTVSVSFGQFHGPPSARVVMDRFPSLAGFLAAAVVGSSGEPDAADDLLIAEANEAEGRVDVTVLFGSGARAMTAPLILADVMTGQPKLASPVALVLGALEGEADLDLFTVGFGPDETADAILYEGDGTGELTGLQDASWPRTFESQDAIWASGDVDGDGEEEIAAAEVHTRRQLPGQTSLLLFDPHPDDVGDPVFGDVVALGTHALAFGDLDGDDDADLDLMIAFDALLTNFDAETLYVAWNQGGELDEPRAVAGGEGCIDAVAMQLDTDAPPELIALCRTSASPNDELDLRRFDAVEPETLVATGEPLARVSGGRTTRLRVGDIDGDGLDDLVVSTRGGEAADVAIFLQHDVHDKD